MQFTQRINDRQTKTIKFKTNKLLYMTSMKADSGVVF